MSLQVFKNQRLTRSVYYSIIRGRVVKLSLYYMKVTIKLRESWEKDEQTVATYPRRGSGYLCRRMCQKDGGSEQDSKNIPFIWLSEYRNSYL